MTRWTTVLPLLALLSAPAAAQPAPKLTAEQTDFFETKVRPVLAEKCYSCHGEKKQSAGLRLDTAAGVKQGADDGPVVLPGDPAKSRLVKAVRREGDYAMPPKDALPAAQVADLTEWVRMGAPFPADQPSQKATTDPTKHWAFQPVKAPPVPATKQPIAHPIDAFVVSKLEGKGMTLSPPADRRTLIRRASYDLTGLPPTPEEIEAFEKDQSPTSFEKVVDRLLASPAYGERWGRHWLDVARYADTKGYVFTEERAFAFAYTYRDYVIRSFNDDKPFDRFVVEQLAADKLPLGEDKSALAAMGFLTLGRRFLNNTHDIIDDRIDVVTRGLMGLSVACARCHDHKYDPIPAKDYYSLYGVFASSVEPRQLPLLSEKRTPEQEAYERELAKKEADVEAEKVRRYEAALAKLRTPDAIGDYLRAALDARGKTPEQVQAFARERDLNGFVLGRWRPYLTEQLKVGNSVLTPLAALHSVPDAEFATKSAATVNALPKAHPAVKTALATANPKTLRDAATVVGKVIAQGKDDAALAPVLGKGGPLDIPVAEADKLFNRVDRDALVAARKKVDAFQATSPNAPPRAHVLADGPVQEPVVFLRGNPGNRGPAVPRQMVAVAAKDRQPFKQGSGRLELANAIASPDNPLTARVFVNRVWAGHFGLGLVRTLSDFGVRSDPPTHPELLDWLAHRFVADGWSPKRLHKLIMLSATYQQASAAPDAAFRADPENKLLARQNRRRLDFEALRDSLLVGAGKLDRTVGGRPVDLFKAPFTTRRSVYGLIDRTNLPGTFRVFDVANPDQHSPQRFLTTVPQQALFLMNSPFVQEHAKALAARPEMTSAGNPDAKVTALYRLALGRVPTPPELALGREFVADATVGRWDQYAQVLLLSNEFAFVD